MGVWNDGKTSEQVARKVLGSHLVRCHRSISKDYTEIANMSAEGSADFLLHLQDTGRIDIKLYNQGSDRIGCRITELGPQADESSSADGE